MARSGPVTPVSPETAIRQTQDECGERFALPAYHVPLIAFRFFAFALDFPGPPGEDCGCEKLKMLPWECLTWSVALASGATMIFSREMERDHWRIKGRECFWQAVEGHLMRTWVVLGPILSLIQLFPALPNAKGG